MDAVLNVPSRMDIFAQEVQLNQRINELNERITLLLTKRRMNVFH